MSDTVPPSPPPSTPIELVLVDKSVRVTFTDRGVALPDLTTSIRVVSNGGAVHGAMSFTLPDAVADELAPFGQAVIGELHRRGAL